MTQWELMTRPQQAAPFKSSYDDDSSEAQMGLLRRWHASEKVRPSFWPNPTTYSRHLLGYVSKVLDAPSC